MNKVFLLNEKDIPENSARGISRGVENYLVIKLGGKIYVYEDRCSHQDMPISENYEIDGEKITCGWHGAEFDIKTGKNLSMPAPAPIKKISIEIDENGNIFALLK